MHTLDNKVALVTGASRGIGAGIALELAKAGATVIVNYANSKKEAAEVVARIIAAGGRAEAVQGDFSNEEDIARVFATIKEGHQRLDILVNNAGMYAFFPVEELTPAKFHHMFDLNVLGLLMAIRQALPLFGPQGGSIINIGSIAGSMAAAEASVYAATKGAVDAISLSLSKELGARKIRVNSLNPGLVETEGTVAVGIINGAFHDFALKTTPLGRVGTPQDIGRAAVLLASDHAYWITGQALSASGGLTM